MLANYVPAYSRANVLACRHIKCLGGPPFSREISSLREINSFL